MRLSKQQIFIQAYVAAAGSLQKAAEACGMHRTTHYKWLKDDEGYRRDFAAAQQECAKAIEDEAIRRAIDGVERLKFHRGHVVMIPVFDELGQPIFDTVPDGADEDGQPKTRQVLRERPVIEREYSDSVLIRLLAGWMPEKYGRTEVTGPGGGPIDQTINVIFRRPAPEPETSGR